MTDPDRKPPVGSLWRAQDGRLMRVEKWCGGAFGWWAELTVLNPTRGQRKRTTAALGRFGGFLVREKVE